MNTGTFTRMVLAVGLIGMMQTARAQTNLTQEILQKQIFREGLVCLTNTTPTEAENRELLEVVSHLQEPWWTAGLEQFFKDHPDSAWAASLHYDYASFCRRTGRTTKALEQFAAAWALLKNEGSPQGRQLGGTVLANWTDLLASLGRAQELKPLIAAGDQWPFANAHDRNQFQGAKNSYYLILMHPEMAFRCGTFALKAVGGELQPGNPKLESLVQVPSPTNGFSLAGLEDLAKKYGLNLVPAKRTAGQALVVPSVVHWRQNHYAAILERRADMYLVNDPTFGGEKWLPAEVINEEASGEFLIPATADTNGWQELARNDAQTIHGMGLPDNIKDGQDKYKKPLCPQSGMPVWWVSEPYINLWISDEPISYLTSRGEPFSFQLTYKQRDSRPVPTDYRVSNVGWNNSWTSYIRLDSETPCYSGCQSALANSSATVYLPNGGEVDFNPGQNYDPETRLLLLQQYANGPGELQNGVDTGESGFLLVHADGSQDVYGLVAVKSVTYGDYYSSEFLWTRHIAPNGDTTWFDYDAINFNQYLLANVLDPDGRTNTLAYTANNQLSSVTNAYGQSAHFKYDASGNLTNLVDAQGLSSSLTYDTNGYPTRLITPYGTNQFSIVENIVSGEGNFGGDNLIDRAVLATDPVEAKYLYLYRYDSSSFMATAWPSGTVPTNTPLGTLDDGASGTNFLTGVCYRNSFFWGPRQYAGLSTTTLDDFTATDYLRGRMQHWLEDTNQLDLTGYLSVQRDPSPDGSTPGLLTFFDYLGKLSGYNFCAGNNALPAVTAWRLPSGETHYEYRRFDYFGNVTNDITTCTQPDGSLGTRTNRYVYADNTYSYVYGTWNGSSIYDTASYGSYTVPNLLTQIIGADGNPIWSYGGFDSVSWTNLFYPGSQTNATIQTSSRVLPDYATNGLGQATQYTFSSAGNPVTDYDYWPGTSGFPNGTYGVPYGTTFPGYSKITSITTPAGLTTTNLYNANGFLAQTIDQPVGRTNAFGYTTDGLVGAFTNALGLNVSLTWDNLLRPTAVHYPDGTSDSITYSKLDPYFVSDRLGNTTVYLYDGARRLNSIIYTYNSSFESFDWCGCGALTGITDALYQHTTLNYDNAGSLTNISYTNGVALNYQYNLAGQVTNVFDGAGRALQVTYNNQGLVTAVSNAFGRSWSATYDLLDRPVVVTDANGVTVTNTFDALNRVVQRTWPDGISESYGYNAAGLMAYTNRDQKVTYYGRDAAGRFTSVTNANLEVTRFGYNPADELTSLTNGLNYTTTWQYNEYGWLTNKVDGLGRTAFRLAYNANGWVTNRWTPEKGNTGYTYDGLGNLLAINYPLSTINYSYDLINELTNLTDQTGTTQFRYTPTGQLAGESNAWAQVNYSYEQGLRTNLTIGSWTQSYGYDPSWRLTNTVSPAGTFAYSFNFQPASALVTGIQLPNGANIVNGYDTLARLTGTTLNNHWGHTLDGYTYTPDALGLRTNLVRNLGLTTNAVTAGFDHIGQLTSWDAAETGGTPRQNEQLGWNYDAAHNLHYRTNNLLTQTFTTDAANQLNSVSRTGTFTLSGATPAPAANVTVNGLTAARYGDLTFAATNLTLADGNNTFTIQATNIYGLKVTNTLTINLPASVTLHYDNNGNLTNDGTRTFGYDAENQLTNVSVAGAWKSEYVYDGLNRRRINRDYIWQGGGWVKTNEVRIIYAGRLPLQERDTNNNVLVTYTRGLDLSGSLDGAGGIGGLLARQSTITNELSIVFYHSDAIGNITALMDGNENIVARYLWNPFGKLEGKWGSMADANEMQFSSMLQHDGIVFYPFRGYEPNFQRFLTQDPVGENGGINLYRAMNNNPVNWIDPYGLLGWSDFNPALLVNGQAWSQLGSDIFMGNTSQAVDPNSYQALMANNGTPLLSPLTDQNGNQLGNPASAVGGAVVGGIADAASLMAGGGEAKATECEAKSIWSSTKAKNAVENAFSHWEKHQGEFPEFQNAKQYVEGAQNFFENPPPGTLTKINSNGDKLFYDPASNTFGVQAANGVPRTLFRPTDGINYWNRQ